MKDKIKNPTDAGTSAGLNTTSDSTDTITPPPPSLNLIDLSFDKARRKTEWLLENAIPMHHYTIIYGEGGMGKSLIATYLGIQASRGRQSFCGLKFPERPLKTLLLDYELDEDQKIRIKLICIGLGLAKVPETFECAQPKKPITELIPEIKDYIKSQGIELILIDSIAVAGVDPLDVMPYIQFTVQLRELKVTCLIMDHQAKLQALGNYKQKTAFGTVYKRNLARSEFQISSEPVHEDSIVIEMSHKKSNFGRKLNQLKTEIVFSEDKITFNAQGIQNLDEADYLFIVHAIKKLRSEKDEVLQTDILKELKRSSHLSKSRALSLLATGEGTLWRINKGARNSKQYELIET